MKFKIYGIYTKIIGLFLLFSLNNPANLCAQATTWIGVNTTWNNVANWTNGIPTNTSDVTIPNNRTFYPVLPSDITIQSLILGSTTATAFATGAKIDFAGFILTVDGGNLLIGDRTVNLTTANRELGNLATGGKLIVTGGQIDMRGRYAPLNINVECDLTITQTNSFWRNITFHRKVKVLKTNNNNSQCGGNTFKDDVDITHQGGGDWQWGFLGTGGGPDVFEKKLTVNVTNGRFYLGSNSTNNQFKQEAKFTISNTGAVDVQEGVFEENVNFEINTLVTGGSNSGIIVANAAGKTVNFKKLVTIKNVNSNAGSLFRCAIAGNVIFEDDVTIENNGGTTGTRRIELGSNLGSAGVVTLSAGKTIQTSVNGFTSGELQVNKLTQVGGINTHSHNLTVTGTANIIFNRNIFEGNLTVYGENIVQVRNSTFGSDNTNLINITSNCITNGLQVFCGGNTFKGITTLKNNARSQWFWGHTTASAVGDVFETDAFFIADDIITPLTPNIRPSNYQTNYQTNLPTNNTTTYPTTVNYIAPPYYIPKSGTWTGTKVGFATYPQLDNLPTNTGNPASDAANATTNQNANLANIANEDASEQNILNATLNAYKTIDLMDPNRVNLTDAIRDGNSILTAVFSTPAYLNNEGNVQTLYNNLQNIINTGNTYLTTFDGIKNTLQTLADDSLNAPGNDHIAANNAITALNQANQNANNIYLAINQLNTELNTVNNIFNTNPALVAVINNSNNTGILAVGYNQAGNVFKGVSTFDAKNKGRIYIGFTTGSDCIFEGNTIINNTSQGSNFNAYYIGYQGANPTLTFKNNLTINQNGGGKIFFSRNGVSVLEKNLIINQINGNISIGVDNTPGSVRLDGDPSFNLQAGTFELSNFTKSNTNASNITTQGTSSLNINGTSILNGNIIINNRATNIINIGSTTTGNITFNGDVSLINENNQRIDVSNRGTANFNGNLFIENRFALTTNISLAIAFGQNTGKSFLADGKRISVGVFQRGLLSLAGFTQLGTSQAQLIQLITPLANANASIYLDKSTTFNANTEIQANRLRINASIFNNDFRATCFQQAVAGGGNLFKQKAAFEFRGTGSWVFGDINKDTYEGEVEFYNRGTDSKMYVANKSLGNVFNQKVTIKNGGSARCNFYVTDQDASSVDFKGEVVIENYAASGNVFFSTKGNSTFEGEISVKNDVGGNILFGGSSIETTHIGKIIVTASGSLNIDPLSVWARGSLHLKNFTFNSTTPININLLNLNAQSTFLYVGPGSSFNAPFDAKTKSLFLNGATFNADASFEKAGTNNLNDLSLGGNVFNGFTKIINSSNSQLYLAGKKGDDFNGDVIFSVPNNSRIFPAYKSASSFSGNITITGVLPINTSFDFGGDGSITPTLGKGTGSVILDGTGSQLISNQLNTRDITIRELTVKQGNSTSVVNIDNTLTITKYLSMSMGKILLANQNLNILNSTDANSVAILNPAQSYIVADASGVVNRQVPNASINVAFPIGNSITYTPATLLQDASGVSDNYQVRILNNVYLNYGNVGTNYTPTAGSEIQSYFTRRTWIITETTVGGSNADITLQWNSTAPSDELPNFDRNNVSVVRYNNTTNKWSCTQPYGSALGPPNTRRTTTAVKNMGVFSIATVKAIAGPDQIVCSPNDINLAATSLDSPFEGMWTQVSGPSVIIADNTDPASLVSGLQANTTYVFRWSNQGLEGNCGTGIYDDVTINVGNSGVSSSITSVTWTGLIDNDWFNCGNWTNFTIPNVNIDVTIPNIASLPNAPVITLTGPRAKSLTIQNGGILTINATGSLVVENDVNINPGGSLSNANILKINANLSNDGLISNDNLLQIGSNFLNNGTLSANNIASSVELSGNFTNNVNFTHNIGTFKFLGNTNVVIDGTGTTTLFNAEISKAIGKTITLNQPVHLAGTITFFTGIIKTTSINLLIINDNATSSTSNADSFVSGPMRKIGDDNFEFPIGKNNRWARLMIRNLTNTNINDFFTAEYFPQNYGDNTVLAPLNNVSALEYWLLERGNTGGGAGTTQTRVGLFWEDANFSQINYLGVNALVVAHYNGTDWENEGGVESYISGGQKGNVISTSMIGNFSPFTFASLTPNGNPLPVSLVSFEAKLKDNQKVQLNWTTSAERNTRYFEVERSQDGINYAFLSRLDAAGNSNSVKNYQTIDNQPFTGISYYRLKIVDTDDKINYSQTVSVRLENGNTISLDKIYPNPFVQKINVSFNLPKGEKYQIKIKDLLGRIVFSQDGSSQAENNSLELDLNQLSNNNYFIEILSSKGKIIKQISKIF